MHAGRASHRPQGSGGLPAVTLAASGDCDRGGEHGIDDDVAPWSMRGVLDVGGEVGACPCLRVSKSSLSRSVGIGFDGAS